LHGKGPLALKRKGLETVPRQMIAIGGMPAAGMELISFLICVEVFGRFGRRNGEKAVRLEQSDAEDERERDPALGCAHHPRLRIDASDRRVNRSQLVGADKVTLVEQNDVAVTELVARSLALEAVEAEVGGIATVMIESTRRRSRNSERRKVSTTGSGSETPLVSTTR
jgi:hypothetical protein